MTFGNSCEEYNYAMKKSGTPLTLNQCNEEYDLGVLFLKFTSTSNRLHVKLIV